ncbi:metallophosphoesterase, partial [Enterococcus faecalis]|uniref:metallophosphoesterase n=1 Tax=Enterococcus faecalis TaxID=1351 RepID=UPI003CC5B9A7
FSVGDLVDRGPESSQVGAWLDKPWFHAICGNHDFMAWRSALGDPFQDVDHKLCGGEWLEQLLPGEREQIGQRLAALPLALEVETPAGLVGLV